MFFLCVDAASRCFGRCPRNDVCTNGCAAALARNEKKCIFEYELIIMNPTKLTLTLLMLLNFGLLLAQNTASTVKKDSIIDLWHRSQTVPTIGFNTIAANRSIAYDNSNTFVSLNHLIDSLRKSNFNMDVMLLDVLQLHKYNKQQKPPENNYKDSLVKYDHGQPKEIKLK